MTAADDPVFHTPVPVPADIARQAAARGWPDGLIQRAYDLRVDRGAITFWLSDEGPPAERVERALNDRERVMFGTLRVREAAWNDDDMLADLFAHAPEAIGDWQVTVERSPYPFAQFRLQERAYLQVVEDRGVALAVAAHSTRNTLIGKQRLTANITSSFRVREGFRGQGFSNLVRGAGPACAWFGLFVYWYVRTGNRSGADWIRAINPDAVASLPPTESASEIPGTPVTIQHLPAHEAPAVEGRIRPARRGDARRCVALINRTHRGLDLFRPYTAEHLRTRLDDPHWGSKPPFIPRVYGWADYYVAEDADGRVVACGGLWDRGANVREVWRHSASGEERTVTSTALLDWGYEEGHAPDMARLVRFLLGRTAELQRDDLAVPFQHEPELLDLLADTQPAPETRILQGQGFREGGIHITVWPTRPDTDLAYW